MNRPEFFPRWLCGLLLLSVFSLAHAEAAAGSNASPSVPVSPSPIAFGEVWAYLLAGEEDYLQPGLPITDLAYFGASLSPYGQLTSIPSRDQIKSFKGRVHLVVAETSNFALTHFVLDPEYPLRDALVADIAKAAASFDGVQLDFEAVPARDFDNFRNFAVLLKKALGESKTLSLALPAVTADRQDRYDYGSLGSTADRIVIMAYDEHWAGSDPGPVASMDWCRRVAVYAGSKIAPAKLIMGAPFYGRSWASKNLSRAYKYSRIAGMLLEKQLAPAQRLDSVPFLQYSESIDVTTYYEDAVSAGRRLSIYKDAGIDKVAFWRLGQEDPGIWTLFAATLSAPPSQPVPVDTAVKPGPCPPTAVSAAGNQPPASSQAAGTDAKNPSP